MTKRANEDLIRKNAVVIKFKEINTVTKHYVYQSFFLNYRVRKWNLPPPLYWFEVEGWKSYSFAPCSGHF